MENQADYIKDAKEMLGKGYNEPAAVIEQPRHRIVLRDGLGEEWTVAWVKLSTAFKPHIKEIRGAPLAVWLYISLSINRKGVAFPGIRTIAEDTGYSHQGVLDAITKLEEKGYLTVTRGEKKHNLYEPEFAAIGRSNEPTETVNLVDSSKLSQVLPPDESSFSPDESSPLDSNKRNKRNKKGDLVDGLLAFAEQSRVKGADKVEQLIQDIERGIKANIARTTANQAAAKKILKDGRPFEKWLTWCIQDEWRASHLYIYADIDRIWREYPQAFSFQTNEETPEYQPYVDPRADLEFVPNPRAS